MASAETVHQLPFPWQTKQWRRLWLQHDSNKLAHAYLLAGPSGLGKALFARQFARLMLCAEPEQRQPCENCRSCQLSAKGNHPDIRWVEPEEGARDIKIDQIRNLAEYAVQTSHAGGVKTAVIDQAHQMNSSAFNALLKTLEEPTPGTYLFLVSEAPGSLSSTIRSRCQRLQFNIPDIDQASEWLQQRLDPGLDTIKLLAVTNNQPLKALELARSGNHSARESFINDLCLLLQGRQSARQLVNQAIKLGEMQAMECLLETLIGLIKGLIARQHNAEKYASGGENTGQGEIEKGQLNFTGKPAVQELLSQLGDSQVKNQPIKTLIRELAVLYQSTVLAVSQFNSGSNPNPQLAIESLMWRCKKLSLRLAS